MKTAVYTTVADEASSCIILCHVCVENSSGDRQHISAAQADERPGGKQTNKRSKCRGDGDNSYSGEPTATKCLSPLKYRQHLTLLCTPSVQGNRGTGVVVCVRPVVCVCTKLHKCQCADTYIHIYMYIVR